MQMYPTIIHFKQCNILLFSIILYLKNLTNDGLSSQQTHNYHDTLREILLNLLIIFIQLKMRL